ncbi:hypothetical protein FA13DRAFT_1739448, partial [Coprinellus micaceus]
RVLPLTRRLEGYIGPRRTYDGRILPRETSIHSFSSPELVYSDIPEAPFHGYAERTAMEDRHMGKEIQPGDGK